MVGEASGSGVRKTKEQELQEKYGKTPTPVLTSLQAKVYSDESFKSCGVYELEEDLILTDAEIKIAGRLLAKQLTEGGKSKETIYLMMVLLLNIKKVEKPEERMLKKLDWGARVQLTRILSGIQLTTGSMADIEKEFPDKTDLELNALADQSFKSPNTAGMSEADALAEINDKRETHRSGFRAQWRAKNRNDKKNKEAGLIPALDDATAFASNTYWTFLAGYLMKAAIKKPENVVVGTNHMRKTYRDFYPDGIIYDANITAEVAKNIGIKLNSDKKVLNTILGACAEFEKAEDASTQSAGVMRFLIATQFGYHAMAGYSLFKEVLLASKWSPGEAIMKLWSGPTEKALDMINTIITEFETTQNDDGSVMAKDKYFKYARWVNPSYFLALQPTQCLSLLYLCAKVLNHYISFSEISNPLQMEALKKLGKSQAIYLDLFVGILLHEDSQNAEGKTELEIKADEAYLALQNKEAEDEHTRATAATLKAEMLARNRGKQD